jgi:hypothetical protein
LSRSKEHDIANCHGQQCNIWDFSRLYDAFIYLAVRPHTSDKASSINHTGEVHEKMKISSFFKPVLPLLTCLSLLTSQDAAAHSPIKLDHDFDHHQEHHEHRHLQEKRKCGSELPSDGGVAAEEAFQKWLTANDCSTASCSFVDALAEDVSEITVDVIWHDIQKDDGSEGSGRTIILASMDVLNEKYAGTGFSFTLLETTQTRSDAFWEAHPDNFPQAEIDMKTQLRKGDCSTLNVYSNGVANLLGWAAFPSDCASEQTNDGVVINYKSVPGGEAPYDEGLTLVHGKYDIVSVWHCCPCRLALLGFFSSWNVNVFKEVGHWLGLYHTFQGGCEE